MTRAWSRAELAVPAPVLAPLLLGSLLTVRSPADEPAGPVTVRLTEVEAYTGRDDPASHAAGGPTLRSAVMHGPAGHAYVMRSYGLHWCLNVSCDEPGTPGAVLLRAAEVVDGVDVARSRRGRDVPDAHLARGPAVLARVLALTGVDEGADLLAGRFRLVHGDEPEVAVGPRVGITKAADRPWRFWAAGDPTVSAFRAGVVHRRAEGDAAVRRPPGR